MLRSLLAIFVKLKMTKASPNKTINAKKQLPIKLKPPPFDPPGKAAVDILKRNKDQTNWPIDISYQRFGPRKQYYTFFIRKGCIPISMKSLQKFLTSDNEEALKFKRYTNILNPPLHVRKSRKEDVPVKIKINNVVYKCLFSVKPDDINNDAYALHTMNSIRQVLEHHDTVKNTYNVIENESKHENISSLDTLLTDASIKDIIYHHFYNEELHPDNYDYIRDRFEMHEELTKSFYEDSGASAFYFFSPFEGIYSNTAKSFGYKDHDRTF